MCMSIPNIIQLIQNTLDTGFIWVINIVNIKKND